MLAEYCDTDLLIYLKQDDTTAFNAIYKRYSKPVYTYLLHKLKDQDICNDVLQDIFVNVWEKRGELDIDTSLKAYLFQAARFKIIDIYRRDVKYQKYLSGLADYIVDHSLITDRIDQRKKLQDIEVAVNKMPEKMREIFILSRFKHQSTNAIASKTNLSNQTVKNQISKALRILRLNYMSIDVIFLFTSFILLLS
ncbi:RNA polymerase sigma factor [Mucilaginibacter sp.]|uniref:RNA polymerase sigma factor n=1 Tax=Mucilaginibacter sp. TaxID=1882438 RepID=UPI003D0BCF23